ncbi:MAG: DUF6428 family protein [Planctomycetota bacterium]
MTVAELTSLLSNDAPAAIHVMLPDGAFVPAHFHVTEVARVRKDFVDCGGTRRTTTSCSVQVWVADDVDHRLDTAKLAQIFEAAAPILESTDLPVEVEYEADTIALYPLAGVEVTPSGLLLRLVAKHTDCLAPDRCGVTPGSIEGCGTSGCC